MPKVKCERCGHEWDTSSVMHKVTCPDCGYKTPVSRVSIPRLSGSRLPVSPLKIGITLAVVVALVTGMLLMSGGQTLGPATVCSVPGASNVVWTGEIPSGSGIENIYIVDSAHAAGWDINFGDPANSENVLGVIESDAGSCDIDYFQGFVIVVAVKGHVDNMAYVQKENLCVELAASDAFTITQENSIDANEYVFDESEDVYIRTNVIWDNATAGYELAPDESVELNPVRLWTWS